MKKIASLLLATVMFISFVLSLSSCSRNSKFDELLSFISENGIEADGKISISKNLSELGEVWKDDDASIVTISYDKVSGFIIMEETIDYGDHTAYYKAVCDENNSNVDVNLEYTYSDGHSYYYNGYILKASFSDTNKQTAVYGFETNANVFGEENAKAVLGLSTDILLGHITFLLRNVNCPVTLKDIGFKSI